LSNGGEAGAGQQASEQAGSDNFGDILQAQAADVTRKEAQAALREKNKDENQAQFTLLGDIRVASGVTFNVRGWEKFDGKYIVESSKHTINSNGYVVSITSRKVLRY
jgi:phage protein D